MEEQVFTVFVDNLPMEMHSEWLFNIFSKCGRVVDIYIPAKVRVHHQVRFGFVRYGTDMEACAAIKSYNGIWLLHHRLRVHKALYGLNRSLMHQAPKPSIPRLKRPGSRDDDRAGTKREGLYTYQGCGQPCQGMQDKVGHPKRVTIVAPTCDSEWIKLCLVGIPYDSRSMFSIQEAMLSEGVFDISLSYLGNERMLLKFSDASTKLSFMTEERQWLQRWFSRWFEWTPQVHNLSRRVWLSIRGVPLHAWHADTFTSIATNWGTVLMVDKATVDKSKLEVGRVLIHSELGNFVHDVVTLLVNGREYDVQVIEESTVHFHSGYGPALRSHQTSGVAVSASEEVIGVEDNGEEATSNLQAQLISSCSSRGHKEIITTRNGVCSSVSPAAQNSPLPRSQRPDGFADALSPSEPPMHPAVDRVVQCPGKMSAPDPGLTEGWAGCSNSNSISTFPLQSNLNSKSGNDSALGFCNSINELGPKLHDIGLEIILQVEPTIASADGLGQTSSNRNLLSPSPGGISPEVAVSKFGCDGNGHGVISRSRRFGKKRRNKGWLSQSKRGWEAKMRKSCLPSELFDKSIPPHLARSLGRGVKSKYGEAG